MTPLRALTSQLPHPTWSLADYLCALGAESVREPRGWVAGVSYVFTDKEGRVFARQVSTAWRWVCKQYNISTATGAN